MCWEDIEPGQFNEENTEHVQALREICLSSGRAAYTLHLKKGWQLPLPPYRLNELAHEAFAVNMTRERPFPQKLRQPLEHLACSYYLRWLHQMAAWWLEGSQQAEKSEKEGKEDESDV